MPGISVVMPSLNQARFVRQAIESVLDQRYADLELIVIDGGSTDGSVSIIRSLERHLTWWISEPDAGQSAAINKGIARACGQVCGWLNSDDLLLDGALDAIAEAFRSRPDTGLLFGDGLRIDEHGRVIEVFRGPSLPVDKHSLALGVDYLLQPATFFARRAFLEVGGLDEDLTWCLDWDLWIRLLHEGYPAHGIDAQLAASREYPATKTSSGGFDRWAEIRRVAERHSGMALTPGALAYFLHTLRDYLSRDPRAIHYLGGLLTKTDAFWAAVSDVGLRGLDGRPSPFPTSKVFEPDRGDAPADLPAGQRRVAEQARRRALDALEALSDRIAPDARTLVAELSAHVAELHAQNSEQEADVSALRADLRQLRSLIESHAERLNTLERRLLVRAGRALRLI